MYLNQVLSIWFVIMCSVRYSLWKVFFRFSVCVRFRSPTIRAWHTGLFVVCGCVWGCVCGGVGALKSVSVYSGYLGIICSYVNSLSLFLALDIIRHNFFYSGYFISIFFLSSFRSEMHNTRTCIVLGFICSDMIRLLPLSVCLSLSPSVSSIHLV